MIVFNSSHNRWAVQTFAKPTIFILKHDCQFSDQMKRSLIVARVYVVGWWPRNLPLHDDVFNFSHKRNTVQTFRKQTIFIHKYEFQFSDQIKRYLIVARVYVVGWWPRNIPWLTSTLHATDERYKHLQNQQFSFLSMIFNYPIRWNVRSL